MSDLFPIPESPLPPLEAARRRLAKARVDLINCPNIAEQYIAATDYCKQCREEVSRLEQEELRK